MLSRAVVGVLDCVTLSETALDADACAALPESVAVAELGRAAEMLVGCRVETVLPHARACEADGDARWRRRYFAALARLDAAGVPHDT